MVRRFDGNRPLGSLGVEGNEAMDGEGEREGTLQVDWEREGSGASIRLTLGETKVVETEEERIEASTPHVAPFETDDLHNDDSAD